MRGSWWLSKLQRDSRPKQFGVLVVIAKAAEQIHVAREVSANARTHHDFFAGNFGGQNTAAT